MRYELVATNPVEEEILATNPAARVLFDPVLPIIQARSLMAAVELGLFKAMGRRSRSAVALARDLDLDPDAVGLLLTVLACAGYVSRIVADERTGERKGKQLGRDTGGERTGNADEKISEDTLFRLTDLAVATLLADSPMPLSAWVQHNAVHWTVLSQLEEVLKTGKGIDAHGCLVGEKQWCTYQSAMLQTARPVARWLASEVPVPEGATRLLDIGGSHGLYGALICRAHPPLRSDVLELPAAVGPARELAQNEGIDDVVDHHAGDALTEDLGIRSVDVVFLGNLIHHFTPDQNRALLTRIRAAVRPRGTVAIWDFNRPDAGAEPDLVRGGLALLFRIGSSACCYGTAEVAGWLESAGFGDVVTRPTPGPAHLLVTGRVT